MRLIIVSDNHGNSRILNEIASRYIDEVDGFVHCGDSELSDKDTIWNVMDTVAGNCDYDRNLPDIYIKDEIEFPYLIVHGHQHGVRYSLDELKQEAKAEDVKFVFYGHTHVLKFDKEDDIYIINPGSIQQPRGELREKTYCLLEAKNDEVSIRVFNQNHVELPELYKKWSH